MAKTKQEIYQNRPVSPHLLIYRPQISSTLSIMHRLTGMGLFFSMSVLSWWFTLWVFDKFNPVYLDLAQYKIVKLALIITSFAGFFHLLNGIRHLMWDAGFGFSIKAVDVTGWTVVASAIASTVVFWTLVV